MSLPHHQSVSSKKSAMGSSVDWQQVLQTMDLNSVHKNRHCEFSVIMENDLKALTYIRQLTAANILDDTIIVVDVEDVYNFFNEIMFKMPPYLDPVSRRLFTDVFTKVSVMDLKKLMETCITTKMLIIKLRILAALKEHIFKYEDPIRRRETLMEEYKMLIDVPIDTASKKKGSKKKQKPTKGKSKSSKSTKKGKKKGLDKEGKAAEPCLMLEHNERKQILQPRWHSVALKPRTLQILIANCYAFSYLNLFDGIKVPLKCLLEVSLPSIAYPEVVASLRGDVSNVSIYSFNDTTTTTTTSANSILAGDDSKHSGQTPNREQAAAFWQDFEDAIHSETPTAKYMSNMFYLKYVPIDMPIEEGLPFYEDQCLVTHDEIKYLLHSTDTVERMYAHYVDNIKVFNMTLDPLKPVRAICCRKYAETLNSLPPDVCSVPIILDALLNEVEFQVAKANDDDAPSENDKKSAAEHPPKYYSVRHLFTTLLKEYRMYSPPIDDVSPICSTADNSLLHIKIDKNQIRMHEHNKMAGCFHSYLNIRVPLQMTFLDVMKRQPLCNILRSSCVGGNIKTCNEIADLTVRLMLDPEQVLIYLGTIIFNLINWSSYKRYLRKRAKVVCNDRLKKLIEIMTGHKLDELEYCDSVMEAKTCHNINRKLDILFYEKLAKMEMLQEMNSNCHWYNSIKYYYCGLLDSILVEFDNKLNDFGVAVNEWTCRLRTIPNLILFSRKVLCQELRWHIIEEMEHQKGLNAEYELKQKSERDLESIHSIKDDAMQRVSFILKNTLKDVLVNLEPPERPNAKAKVGKKGEKPTKIVAPKDSRKSNVSAYSAKSKSSKTSAINLASLPVATKQPEAKLEKAFFAESSSPNPTILTGQTTTFISKDGVKITFEKNNDLNYNSLNVDLNRDLFIMHISKDEYFKFHFYLQNDIIVNFVKPVNKSVVDQIKMDKLYTVFRNYSYRLNNFQRVLKKHTTYLISDDVLQRIRTKMRNKLVANISAPQTRKTSVVVILKEHTLKNKETPVMESVEQIGDIKVLEVKTKQDALEKLRRAKASQQPAFKICSSKLHQFNYITRKKSHANVNYKDAAVQIGNIKDPPVKRKYLFRELIGSIDNDDMVSNMAYNYSVTMPTTLTVRSEVDIQGRMQIKQFYIDKGPQLRDISLEVSRTFTHHGDVIIKYTDGQVRILSLNGDIVNFEVPLFGRSPDVSKPKKGARTRDKYLRALRRLTKCYHKHTTRRMCRNSSRKQARTMLYQYISPRSLLIARRFKFPYPKFSILRVDGHKVIFREGKYLQRRDYFPRLDEDLLYSTFKFTRQDGTVTELARNGSMITTFPDKTTLTSSYEIDEKLVSFEVLPDDSVNSDLLKTTSWTCSEWVLIHSSREFRHPKYATVRMGGILSAIDIILPCDVTLRQTGQEFNLQINANVEATFDASRIELKSKFCLQCAGCTSTLINIEDLYRNKFDPELPEALLTFRDSFKRYLEILPNGSFVYDDENVVAGGLNMFQCATHRGFNSKKLYLLKRNLSGIRLWPRESYVNRLIQAYQFAEDLPDTKVHLKVDDIYFLLKSYVPLFNRYLMEPIDPEVYFETYRFLQKMPYNKHTKLLFRQSKNVTMDSPPPLPDGRIPHPELKDTMTISEIELMNRSSTTLHDAYLPKFKSSPQINQQQFVDERVERVKRICQKQRESEAAEREKVNLPINYFLYKESQELAEYVQQKMVVECPTDSNLRLTSNMLNLIPSQNGGPMVEKGEIDRESSIRTIYSGKLKNKFKSEVFDVRSYVSTKRFPSRDMKYAKTYSSATLFKQQSVLNLTELSALIHIYNLNQMSERRLQKKHGNANEPPPENPE